MRWYDNKVTNNCLPCEEKARQRYENRVKKCDDKDDPEKCRAREGRWLANQLERCNPSCKGIAKKKR